MKNRNVIIHAYSSLDGFIAKPNDDMSFLARKKDKDIDYGWKDIVDSSDTIIVGRKSYDWVAKELEDGYPHRDKQVIVMTRTPKLTGGHVKFYSGDLKELVEGLKEQEGENIFCDGGSEIFTALFIDKLVDELIITIMPVLLGAGKRLFGDGRPEQEFELISSKDYTSGVVQLHYKVAAE